MWHSHNQWSTLDRRTFPHLDASCADMCALYYLWSKGVSPHAASNHEFLGQHYPSRPIIRLFKRWAAGEPFPFAKDPE